MNIRSLTPLLMCALLSACANTPDMKAMSPSTNIGCIVLATPISYQYLGGMVNRPSEAGLFADIYRPVLEDANGIYYRGAGDAFWWRHASSKEGLATAEVQVHPGGIWVPKAQEKKPRLFIFEDLSGRPPIAMDSAKAAHALAAGSAQPAARGNVPSGDLMAQQAHAAPAVPPHTPIMAGAVGSAIGGAIIGGILRENHGRVVMWEHESDNAAFWPTVPNPIVPCKP